MSIRRISRAAVALLIGATALASAAPVAAAESIAPNPRAALPAPSGPYAVGSAEFLLVDDQRDDPWKPAEKRRVMSTVWYPAARSATPYAPYLSAPLVAAINASQLWPIDLGPLVGRTSWAHHMAPVQRTDRPYPVLLSSPGMGASRLLSTDLASDLASHGYVVIAIDPTYESPVELPDGTVLPGTYPVTQDARTTAIRARVGDVDTVLAALHRGAGLPAGLARAMDLDRIGMFGFSYGGYTAATAMFERRDIKAAINMDGVLADRTEPYAKPPVVERGLDRPFQLMGSDFGDEGMHDHLNVAFDPTWPDIWPNLRGWRADIGFPKAGHASFLDAQSWLPGLPGVSPETVAAFVGTADPAATTAKVRADVRRFFDRFV